MKKILNSQDSPKIYILEKSTFNFKIVLWIGVSYLSKHVASSQGTSQKELNSPKKAYQHSDSTYFNYRFWTVILLQLQMADSIFSLTK